MQFVHSALTWGFLLALVPLLIHLINMMRHRRVQWAAMEFLLASYKKHRKWVWLKQLLLLLARMAAIVLLVAMLAQLKTRDQWLAIFGGRVTHHYVLLDDSYSMSDRVAGATAMDAAKTVLASIVGRATQEDSPQRLTLIRYSQARGLGAASSGASERASQESNDGPETADESNGAQVDVAQVADFNAEPIDANFDVTLERKARTIDTTQLAVGPREALNLLRQLVGQAKDETAIVYVLSDFRTKDWGSPTELREALGQLRRSQAEVHLVNCARSTEPNLGVIAIEPADETRAAGVPLFVNVKVRNFGSRPATRVQLKLQSTFYPPEDLARIAPDELRGEVDDLATLLIEEIGPGESVSRRVQVYFPQPGRHVVEATLPEDPVDSDNRRWCVIDFPDGERTLLIDGSTEQQNAYFLEVAFRPLESSNTGVRPDVKPPAFLRDATLETLNAYSAIYLLDVSRLDGRAAETLEAYVRGGGGLAIFAGSEVNPDYYNQALYRDGQGILPAPLALEGQLTPPLDPSEPDIELSNHPIFAFFVGETNPLIRGVKIDRYRQVAEGWKPPSGSAVQLLAHLRDKSPLVVAKKSGQGEVVMFLTTLAPDWNDWAKNPSFVVVALKLQSYLATQRRLDETRLVGTPLYVPLQASQYRRDLVFVVPGEGPSSRTKIDVLAQEPDVVPQVDGAGSATGNGDPPDDGQKEDGQKSTSNLSTDAAGSDIVVAALGMTGPGGLPTGTTDRAGIYEAWPVSVKGEIDLRRWALNVDPDEGDLAQVPPADLVAKLDPVKVNYHAADQYQQDEVAGTGYNLSTLIMFALVALLLGEQILAWSASYHPKPGVVS